VPDLSKNAARGFEHLGYLLTRRTRTDKVHVFVEGDFSHAPHYTCPVCEWLLNMNLWTDTSNDE
jgi:hypothetical protein